MDREKRIVQLPVGDEAPRIPPSIKLGLDTVQMQFLDSIKAAMRSANQTAKDKGWWDTERNDGEMIALMHAELSEALEGMRDGNPPSRHIPEFSAVEEEFADVFIRIFDTCQVRGYRLGEAILAKMQFNQNRPHKHGGKRF